MTNHESLNQYLNRLDRALGKISVGDRSEIITEIKSHVLEAQAQNPEQGIDSILASLGEPENVANRYLIERGIQPGKPSKSPIVKWLTIGFLGTFALSIFAAFLLIWKFSPLLSVNDETGRVVILGGLIDVNEKMGTLKIGDMEVNEDGNISGEFLTLSGEFDPTPSKLSAVHFDFSNGKAEFAPSSNKMIHWKCKHWGKANSAKIEPQGSQFHFDYSNAKSVKCEIRIPQKLSLNIKGANGKVELEKIQSSTQIEIANGKVSIDPDSNISYQYDLQVNNGKIDSFPSSDPSDSRKRIKISVRMNNGKIQRE